MNAAAATRHTSKSSCEVMLLTLISQRLQDRKALSEISPQGFVPHSALFVKPTFQAFTCVVALNNTSKNLVEVSFIGFVSDKRQARII